MATMLLDNGADINLQASRGTSVVGWCQSMIFYIYYNNLRLTLSALSPNSVCAGKVGLFKQGIGLKKKCIPKWTKGHHSIPSFFFNQCLKFAATFQQISTIFGQFSEAGWVKDCTWLPSRCLHEHFVDSDSDFDPDELDSNQNMRENTCDNYCGMNDEWWKWSCWTCPSYAAARYNIWPSPTNLEKKLYGSLGDLRATAAFNWETGLDIWAGTNDDVEEEEAAVGHGAGSLSAISDWKECDPLGFSSAATTC